MPKSVNHDERRQEIVRATWRVIARGGLAHTTTREIAREAGVSSGILAHYFTDRADILASALLGAHQGVRARIDERVEGLRGLAALREFMLEALPLDDQRRLEARIEACFWGEAVGNETLMRIQNDEVDAFSARARVLLAQASDDGELIGATDIDGAVRRCLMIMDGLSIESVMYPAHTAPELQVAILDEFLNSLRSQG
ncbi:MAG: TetR family transcriptional regulator C-terminal domain-containing protein [Acidimicrobiales bacterium]